MTRKLLAPFCGHGVDTRKLRSTDYRDQLAVNIITDASTDFIKRVPERRKTRCA